MSDDEDDYNRYKHKYKNNISEEEQEDEEELEDENEENSNDSSNQKKDSKKSDNNENNSLKKEENQNEENNEKEQSDSKEGDDNTKNKAEYIAHIEQLENELTLEQNINKQIEDNLSSDEITKLKSELNQKTDLLDKLITTNLKQNSALNLLTRKLNEENKKRMKLKSQDKQESRSREESERSNKNISKTQAVNIVLKVKEKELHNALNKMNVLKSENEALKRILYENVDYKNIIEDKSKETNDKIQKYTNEKNLLIKQLKVHKECLDERMKYNEQYNSLKEELKQIKKNINNIHSDTQNLIKEKNMINLTVSNNNIKLQKNSDKKHSSSLSVKKTKTNNKNKKDIVLPLISSQTINQSQNQNESILTDEFKKKVKEYLNNDEDECMALIEKISNIEKSRKMIENKHKNELKQFNTQIKSLDEQFKLLNSNSKGSNSNIRVLKYQLNTLKGNNRLDAKKLNELKKELQSKIDVSKEKDYEISLLIGKINSLKNLANYGNIEIPQDDISDFIEKIKQENQYIDVYKNDNEYKEEKMDSESDKINKNKKNIKDGRSKIYLKNENKNIAEESIQADFSESSFEDEK